MLNQESHIIKIDRQRLCHLIQFQLLGSSEFTSKDKDCSLQNDWMHVGDIEFMTIQS